VVIRTAIEKGLSKLVTEDLLPSHKLWLDGSLKAPPQYDQETVIGGDAIVPAIMLASVAAKVTRDRLMITLAEEYPQYGFEKHKGYGTKVHIAALREHGLSAVHRATFIHLDRLPIQEYTK
jgi:ribonuclease HII